MKTGIVSAFALVVLSVTPAEAAKYKGEIKGEPDASLALTVKKIDGDRYVTRIAFKDVPLNCEGGSTKTSGDGSAGDGGLEIKRRKFSGPWNFGQVSGKAKGAGKIKGNISISTDAGPPLGDCTSGNLAYVVRR